MESTRLLTIPALRTETLHVKKRYVSEHPAQLLLSWSRWIWEAEAKPSSASNERIMNAAWWSAECLLYNLEEFLVHGSLLAA